jgi:hypothetical protein
MKTTTRQNQSRRLKVFLRLCLTAAIVNVLALQTARPQTAQKTVAPPKPKLVLLIVIDQFRYDFLVRFRDQYSKGLRKFLENGAVFANANLEHYPTVTAVGHSTMLTGATPALSGIIGNDWYDRESSKSVISISDESVRILGGRGGPGASPRRLLVSTVGDELKMVSPRSRVVGLALKDRSAILPAGHMADGAYWFDTKSGEFVSSTYYFADVPQWVRTFNSKHPADQFAGKDISFIGATPEKIFRMPGIGDPKLYEAIYGSEFGNELLESLAEETLRAEQLGQRGVTDLLSVSFSSNDIVGHTFGPDSPEVRDISIRTDRAIGRLFDAIDKSVGMNNVLAVLTSDHGVPSLPENLEKEKMPGGRLQSEALLGAIQTALERSFGSGKWILSSAGSSVYFNEDLIAEKKVTKREVERVAAQAAAAVPHVARVYTRDQLALGNVPDDKIATRVVRSFNPRRSGDIEILLDPYWIRSASGTTHGSAYSYDTHIPLVFMGPGIRPGQYLQEVALNDLAPTLSTMLQIETPSGSVGSVLNVMLIPR